MIVIATSAIELVDVRHRVAEIAAIEGPDVCEVRVHAPSADRRLLLVEAADVWAAARMTAALRAEGMIAVIRPGDGPQLEAWVRHTEPLTFGDRLSICSAWSEHDRSGLTGLIELGLGGFGTGEHPTTRLLIEHLSERLRSDDRILDVGCGSGVLGLCALRLGASRVVAVDIKAEAVESTCRNAELNGMSAQMHATTAPLDSIEGTFDVVVANVARAAIVELAPQLVRLLSPSGWLAVSGISPAQCSLVAGFLRPLVELERGTSGEWSTLVLGRRPE